MTHTLKIMMVAILMAAFALGTQAQDNTQQRKSREQLAETQARHIARELAFDEKTTARFVDVYQQCQREVWALGPRMSRATGRGGKRGQGSDSAPTVKQRFERSQKLLDIRKKYYEKYSTFLSEQQIERVYQLERGMMKKLSQHGNKKGGRR